MNVLMLCYNTTGRGTYWRALQLARGLARAGHTVSIISTSPGQVLRFITKFDHQPGVTLIESPDWLYGPLRSGWDPYNVLARVRWGHHQRFDLVHAFESRPTVIYPALAWQTRGAKLVMDWCDWFGAGGSVEERPNPVTRAILRPVETYFEDHFRVRAAGTTVINSVLRQRAIDLGVRAATIIHLPNGSDLDRLKPLLRDDARRQLGWPLHEPVIGYVGAIFRRDAILMAQAFDRIKQQEPRTRLLLAGYCNVDVEKLVANPEAIIRTGHLEYEQIGLYLSACDVCWLPLCDSGANRGRFPLKINDYIALGRPVVATNVGDLPALITHGKFGVTCMAAPDDLAKSMITLLRNPEQRMVMGYRARELAEREFSWDRIADRLGEFYQQVLHGI